MADFTDPQDAAASVNAAAAVYGAAPVLNEIAEPLGYFVQAGVDTELETVASTRAVRHRTAHWFRSIGLISPIQRRRSTPPTRYAAI